MWVPYDPDLAEIGAIEPEFVEEFDYHATKRVVYDHDIEVQWVSERDSEFPVQALAWHYEDCDINVYKTVLKWRSTIDDRLNTEPTGLSAADRGLWYDTTTGQVKVWDGSSFQQLVVEGGANKPTTVNGMTWMGQF